MSPKENPINNFTETEMEESRRLASSPEMKTMMERVREESSIENAQRDKEYGKQQDLLKQRENLKAQIEKINNELREMLGHDFVE